MYSGDKEICAVCLADNGYIIKFRDIEGEAKVREQRKKQKGNGPYIDMPDAEVVVAKTTGDLMRILKKRIPELITDGQKFDDAFKEASDAEVASSKY